MDFDEAIAAHAQWKLKLSAYLARPDGSLKPEDIEPDNRCKLGQWIHGEGARYAALPEFSTLKTEHANFHRAASGIVRKADSGKPVTADLALGGTSPFSTASSAIVRAIMAMRAHAR